MYSSVGKLLEVQYPCVTVDINNVLCIWNLEDAWWESSAGKAQTPEFFRTHMAERENWVQHVAHMCVQ